MKFNHDESATYKALGCDEERATLIGEFINEKLKVRVKRVEVIQDIMEHEELTDQEKYCAIYFFGIWMSRRDKKPTSQEDLLKALYAQLKK